MQIWLASFPRSGNTFFRNILYQVYGLESSTFHREPNYPVDENYHLYPVVKTHLLPGELIPNDPNIKKVYLVRDGRDALVSIAHHRKDIIEPHTNYYNNLLEAILSKEGTFFGGWSENVRQWTEQADIIIRYEDLIADPIGEAEKLREIIDLPDPDPSKLLDFQSLKSGAAQYGSGRGFLEDETRIKTLSSKNFRRGKAGSWKDEMPKELESLFWDLHGKTMMKLGYERGLVATPEQQLPPPYRVLIEADKFKDPHLDGVKRYLEELVTAFITFEQQLAGKWQIDFLQGGKIISIYEIIKNIRHQRAEAWEKGRNISPVASFNYEQTLLTFKDKLKLLLPSFIYQNLSALYRALPFRDILRWLRTRVAWRQLQRFDQVAQEAHQLIHVPLPQNYYLVSHFDQPKLFTVHDITHRLFPEFHEKDNNKLVERGMQYIEEEKLDIIAVSEATAKDVQANYAIGQKQVNVIHEAANSQWFFPVKDAVQVETTLRKYNISSNRPFLICLSTIEPRKNLKNTIQAFLSILEEEAFRAYQLVICGRRGWKIGHLLDEDHPYAGHIHFTGYVDEMDLPVLYSAAAGMAYVAHYEGFGLPPLEAMKCGTPVIYGDNSAMKEVIADAGLPADSNKTEAIAQQMKHLLGDEEVREDYSRRALKRAHEFSWLSTAFKTLLVYEQIIQRNHGK
jgi:glycosyltransferase involved in cell wall biosynthesis